ncbi:hypothetical protein BOX15_Mlig005984g2, partial [Macrostomum lignano]
TKTQLAFKTLAKQSIRSNQANMAGVVLETLSTRKLVCFGIILLLLQVGCFLLGGLIAPKPYAHEDMLGNKCVDWDANDTDKWFFTRGPGHCKPVADGSNHFEFIKNLHQLAKDEGKRVPNASQIVFNFQFPLPRDNMEFSMSALFQEMVAVVRIESQYMKSLPGSEIKPDSQIELHARLGYRDDSDPPGVWHEMVQSRETRSLRCQLEQSADGDTGEYECEPQPLFSLGSVAHAQYLLNIRVPVTDYSNKNIGLLRDISVVEFHQNGGFTLVWLGMKTALFPVLCGLLIWFCWRVRAQARPWTLLERSALGLGIALSCLNCPVEWLSLTVLRAPVWLLVSDLRHGMFYSGLLAFWIVFTGEHTMDGGPKNRFMLYWKQLLGVAVAGACLLIFDLSERGVQIYNPFYTVWSTPDASRFALASMIIAGISMAAYALLLLVLIVRALRGILEKRRHLPSLPQARRLFYSGAIVRFCVFLGYTALCAALTVAFYIVMELDESHWKWSEEGHSLEYSSAFVTGVYGMWNVYVCAIIILYAPSTKRIAGASGIGDAAAVPTEAANLFTTESDQQVAYSCASERVRVLNPGSAAAAGSAAADSAGASASSAVGAASETLAFVQKAAQD